MKDEIRAWLTYATENLDSAKILLEQHLLNPCLQNVQQSIEKYLKALLLENANTLRKTHSVSELVQLLAEREGLNLRRKYEAINVPWSSGVDSGKSQRNRQAGTSMVPLPASTGNRRPRTIPDS